MNEEHIKELIQRIKKGEIKQEDALKAIKDLFFADLGHTKVDHHRSLRQGAAEVVFAEGKTTAELSSIIKEMAGAQKEILLTRASPRQARAIKKNFPRARHNAVARTIRVPGKGPSRRKKAGRKKGGVLIVSGGTSDAPVVEEARETLEWLGFPPVVIKDVGVAGMHRLLFFRETLDCARVIIVIAGMEGALASVVGGLVKQPVVAVPVSVGYGAGSGGMAALLGMLNSCAAGVTVMNIDNGFGAACAAARIMGVLEREI